ncbi:hypothetical protein AN958_10544, partial [Leucoagaricus sp. SymC.cos]
TPVGERVLIVVTSDSERFVTVDVSGAQDPAFIRESIFTKLHIYTEEEQAQFSIFQTEIGQVEKEDFHMAKALSDDKFFAFCSDQGHSKGSLKFFIKHTPVSNPHGSPRPPPQLPLQSSFTSVTSTFAHHSPTTPLRPNERRPRSGRSNVSSAASE